MAEMGVNSLKAELTNPARLYMWTVQIPGIVGGGDENSMMLRCQASSIPGFGFGEIKVPYKQTAGFKVPGKETFQQLWTTTFIEGEDRKVFDALWGWKKQIVNPTSGVGADGSSIKANIYLTLETTQGTIYNKLKLSGAWVQAVPDTALNFTDDGAIYYSVTFAYDSIESMN